MANQATNAGNKDSQKVIIVSGSPTAGTSLPCWIPESRYAGEPGEEKAPHPHFRLSLLCQHLEPIGHPGSMPRLKSGLVPTSRRTSLTTEA